MLPNKQNHFIVLSFPAQGHINPTLQFAKRLIRTGAHVTFVTSLSAHKRMSNTSTIDGLTYAPFSDGYDDGFKPGDDVQHFMSELERLGSQALAELILSSANERRDVTCVIYAILIPWVADVANNLKTPSVLLWIQPSTVFDIYYYYYNGYKDVISNNNNDPLYSINLPNLPLLTFRDIPSFFLPTNPYSFALPTFEQQLQILGRESNSKPKVLVNTFDALESEALRAVDDKINLIGIGPLIPSAFLDGQDPSDTSFGGDLFNVSHDYREWLDTKEESSVVYVSFGSMSVLQNRQMEEIGRGLIESGLSFLWVIRENKERTKSEEENEILSWIKREGKELGFIVSWCSQMEVLSHPSIGCFLTHCGWNSTLESIVGGVPIVGFPQWTDQGTNAKLVEDVWKMGVRMRENEEEKIVEREEVKRCLKMVMEGERGEEMRRNAKKWKELAKEAVREGGSSERNLRAFLEEIGGGN
ncbi:UDP-glucuronosyl/UDP-glucosyltransferase [Macleaya cordata]|uniref:Glycosyltransferase n=1 Tax=Macleaya cordata TaxID=56857 RepID=A0A200QRA6_MACCD|nr:UDP-glucuronosyl/UDP-glucosyltransferase [Macleaya cordata]